MRRHLAYVFISLGFVSMIVAYNSNKFISDQSGTMSTLVALYFIPTGIGLVILGCVMLLVGKKK